MRWRDSTYLSAGLGIYAVINGTNSAVVTVVGPDKDYGLPTDQQGKIINMVGGHTDLLALIDSTSSPGVGDLFDGAAMGSHMAAVILTPTGFSEILGWNERGWETKWLAATGTESATTMLVSNAYNTYRLWWGHNQRVNYMAVPTGIVNPDQVTTFEFATSGEHITPWLTMDAKDVDGLALYLAVELQRATSTETVVVEYALNYSTTYETALGTISSNGLTTYYFPNSTTPTGTAFRSIRFRLTLARGSTTTTSPDVISMTFVYRKKLKPRWAASCTLDLSGEWKGNSPRQLQNALITAVESNALVEFTFHDDTTSGNPRNYYVDVRLSGHEATGRDYTGQVAISAVEP